MTTPTQSPGRIELLAGGDLVPASPPGAIGGAVINARRHSAGLSRRQLAREMTVGPATVRSWENGTSPLFCMTYDQLRRLAAVLNQGHAPASTALDELLLAAQCDLLVTGMLRGFEDYAEVPPIDEPTPEGQHARDLIRWALTSVAPDNYCPRAAANSPLAEQDVIAIKARIRDLEAGRHGDQLASYGAVLAGLAEA